MHVQVYVYSLYMKICHFLVDVILFFLYIVEEGTGNSETTLQEKDKDDIMVRDRCKRQANVILLIATHTIFVKSSYLST